MQYTIQINENVQNSTQMNKIIINCQECHCMITYNINKDNRKIAILGYPIHEKLSTNTCLGLSKIYFASLEKYHDAVY